ncbi:MAG TPA: DUF86 domain-containing protein [Polyangiaceae bacterium]
MPRREWRIRVGDILDATERALSHVSGLNFEQFSVDRRSIDAVSYAIVVIGEAAGTIPESVTQAAPDIPWADIRGMRNRIAHEYFGIDLEVLWETVIEDLPQLRPAFRALLDRNDLP